MIKEGLVNMIKFVRGELFSSDAEVIVNTVNCVGVMGKGVALEVKKRYPDVFAEYKKACELKLIKPGIMQTVPTGNIFGTQYIINFPTKRHWKAKSIIEDIELGLFALEKEIKKHQFKSIAIPPLGCGNGGLDWSDVKPKIINALNGIEDIEILVYEPNISSLEDIKLGIYDDEFNVHHHKYNGQKEKPKLTEGRRDLLTLLSAYTKENYIVSVNEIHNIAYILQSSGHSLGLEFSTTKNGLFSESLNLVLLKLNNYYLEAFSSPDKSSLIKIKDEEIEISNVSNEASSDKIHLVLNSIKGYRSEAGLELFSIVLWEMYRMSDTDDYESLINNVLSWESKHSYVFKKAEIMKIYSQIRNDDHFRFQKRIN